MRKPRALRLALLLVAATTALARAQAPASTDPADAAAVGATLTPALLRDLPASANLFSLLETTEGEVTSDRFYGGGLQLARGPATRVLEFWTQTQYSSAT